MRHQRQQPKLRLFDEHIFSFRQQIAFRCPQKPFSFQLHYTLSFRKCDGKILFFFCRAYTVWQVIRRWKNTKNHHSRLLQHQNDKLKQFILANVCIPPSYCNNQLNGFFFCVFHVAASEVNAYIICTVKIANLKLLIIFQLTIYVSLQR